MFRLMYSHVDVIHIIFYQKKNKNYWLRVKICTNISIMLMKSPTSPSIHDTRERDGRHYCIYGFLHVIFFFLHVASIMKIFFLK